MIWINNAKNTGIIDIEKDKQMDYVSKIRKYVISKHSENDYKYHISVVVKNALKLAEIKKADKEIVEMAALLHDIGRVKGVRPSDAKENDHHIAGAKIADKYLSKIQYPEVKKKKVLGCILAHRGRSDDYAPKTIEEIVVQNADATAHFISFLDLYRCYTEDEGMKRGSEIIRIKIDREWSKKLTLPEAKKLVKKEYEAISLLLKDMGA